MTPVYTNVVSTLTISFKKSVYGLLRKKKKLFFFPGGLMNTTKNSYYERQRFGPRLGGGGIFRSVFGIGANPVS